MTTDETTIAIMGEDIPASRERIDVDKLLFLPDNPRVYATIRSMTDFNELTKEEQQARIYDRLMDESSVKNLIPEIQRDGGLQNPIIVRYDTLQVIDGNSRLAAYRHLQKKDREDERWTQISCLVVSSLTDEQQTRILGQIHLLGTTEWSPYAKSLFCYRWAIEQNKGIPALSKLTGFTTQAIKKSIKIINLMQDNRESNLSKFSYYRTLVENRKISVAIGDSKLLRNTVLNKVKSEEFTAQEMRDRLPFVIAKPKILRNFEQGNVSLEEAYDRAKISDAEQRLKRIRDSLDDIELHDLQPLEHNQIKAVEQVVRQIRKHVKRVENMVKIELAQKSQNA